MRRARRGIQRHYGGLVFTQEVLRSEDPDRFEEVHFDLRHLAGVAPEARIVLGVVHSYTHDEARALGSRDPDVAGDPDPAEDAPPR